MATTIITNDADATGDLWKPLVDCDWDRWKVAMVEAERVRAKGESRACTAGDLPVLQLVGVPSAVQPVGGEARDAILAAGPSPSRTPA